MTKRLSWDETWLNMAFSIAKRSRCVRDQVGAVIVDWENRIVAVSYNGPPAGWPFDDYCNDFCPRAQHGPQSKEYEDCPSLHAEANGLMVCDRTSRMNGTIYITSAVCFSCAKLIANSGLERVVVPENSQQKNLHRQSLQSYNFLKNCGIEVDEL